MAVLAGLLLVMTGGLASGSFYIPFNKVKYWAWEVYWLIGGLFSWLIVPWIIAFLTIPLLPDVFLEADSNHLLLPIFFGILWGVGGLTFGLALRYLGMALGMAIALGLTAAFGTIIPPLFSGDLAQMITLGSGQVIFAGVIVCLGGIGITGFAGMRKDSETNIEQKKTGVKEFNLKKGLTAAFISGFMNACFAFGIAAGKPVASLAIEHGANPVHQNNPVFILILLGGLIVNVGYCVYMINKNNSGRHALMLRNKRIITNLVLSGIAGTTWFLQFFFYGMGESMMGRYGFAAWSILMSGTIIFSNLWGLYFKEWKGVSSKTLIYVVSGLLILVISTVLIGWGTYLQQFE